MKAILIMFFALCALMSNLHAQADEAGSSASMPKMLMYIQPVEYTNPIQLWHPYYGYWFYQGPVVEAQAMSKLSQAYGDVGVCERNQSGRVLTWIQPSMFYNPQVQNFYGKVTANVYTGMGKFVATYVGEATVYGLLNLGTDDKIASAYALALDNMIAKMQADATLQALVDATGSVSANDATPCSMVTLLPTPKIRAISF